MSSDPYGTHALREAATAAWWSSPARFREDANTEEDHARGYYRDRVVVELAQNAADAAAGAGEPGELLLSLHVGPDGGGVLVAANTGAPLDAGGVASLASLRASAKRTDGGRSPAPAVGRFGVGFAAVRSVADDVAVVSRPGAVHFSLPRTVETLAEAPTALADEVSRRGSWLPVLRLPFAGPGPLGEHAEGLLDRYATVVVLRLRDADAVGRVRDQLAAVGDPLLLALPSLAAVHVAPDDAPARHLADVGDRWVVARRDGSLPAQLLAERPVEEQERTGWQVTWAVPRPGVTAASGTGTLWAPTPTDEPCTVPALLLGTFPLDPSRRHVAPGAVTDHLVGRAGAVWADLLGAARREGLEPLALLPTGLPAGQLDAAVREAVLTASRDVPLLEPVGGGPALRAADAVVLTGAVGQDRRLLAELGSWMPELVAVPPEHMAVARTLGLVETELAEVVEAMPVPAPDRLRTLLDAVGPVDGGLLEQLATLPVPLADGRVVRGARGLTMVDADLPGATVQVLSDWGLRVVHPDAAHPLLERLGAVAVDAAGLLHEPVLRERVLAGDDESTGPDPTEEAEATAEVVLGLLRAALDGGVPVEPAPWWPELLLPAADGDLVPARGLVLPGSDAARWFDPDVLTPVAPGLVARWGEVLVTAGVRDGLTLVTLPAQDETPLTASSDDALLVTDGLEGWDEYTRALAELLDEDPQTLELPEVVAVADLDAVLPGAWPEVLRAMSRGPARRALVEPVRPAAAGSPDGTAPGLVELPSYTAWWLRRRADLGLDRPFALPDAEGPDRPVADRPVDLLRTPPAALDGLDREVLRALGGVASLRELDVTGWVDLLDQLPDAGAPVELTLAVQVWRGLRTLATRPEGVVLDPDRLPALVAREEAAVVPVAEVAVADPLWAQRQSLGPLLVTSRGAAPHVAELLDVDLARERDAGEVTSSGHLATTPTEVRTLFPGCPATWVEHDDLTVDGESVTWWVDEPTGPGDGAPPAVHAATTDGLAAALAWLVGWEHRTRIERLLVEPRSRARVLLDLAGEDPGP